MLRSRITRAFALLVLVVAQGVLALPHRAMAEGAMAQAVAASAAGDDCHSGMPGHAGMPAQQAPSHSCGCCQGSMPASHAGSCLVMASCGPTMATAAAATFAAGVTSATTEAAPTLSAPPAHDFIPDPPPPRA